MTRGELYEAFLGREDAQYFADAISYVRARERLTATLFNLPLIASRQRYAWRGLLMRWGGVHRAQARPHVPFGWRAMKEYDRCTWLVMPMWLYPLYIARRDWRRWVYQPLMRAGLWHVAEGDYYSNGHWAWPTRTR